MFLRRSVPSDPLLFIHAIIKGGFLLLLSQIDTSLVVHACTPTAGVPLAPLNAWDEVLRITNCDSHHRGGISSLRLELVLRPYAQWNL